MDEVPAELPRIKTMLDAALAAPGGAAAASLTAPAPSMAAITAAAVPRPASTQTVPAAAASPPAAPSPITASPAAAEPASGAPSAASSAVAAVPGQSVGAGPQPAPAAAAAGAAGAGGSTAAVAPAAVSGASHGKASCISQAHAPIACSAGTSIAHSTTYGSLRCSSQAARCKSACGWFPNPTFATHCCRQCGDCSASQCAATVSGAGGDAARRSRSERRIRSRSGNGGCRTWSYHRR